MAREVERCGFRVRMRSRLVLQRVGPGLAWPAERCEPARSHKDRSDQVQGRERHRLATTAMANLLQGCNSLGAVNSELRKTPSQKTPQVVEAERLSGTPIFLSCLYCQRGAAASPSGETNTFSQYSGGGESTVKSYPQRLFLFVLSCTQHRYYTGLTPSDRRRVVP